MEVCSFIAGAVSVCLRRRKILGMVGISLTLLAALLSGSRVPIDGERSRLHLVDVAVTRGLTYVPIYVLGFTETALVAYVAFVSVQAPSFTPTFAFTSGGRGGSWRRRSFITGTTALSPPQSIRTSRFTSRCWIACSAPVVYPKTVGRHRTGWREVGRCRPATRASSSIRSGRSGR